MRCFNETLNTNIQNACNVVVGVEPNSWIVPRKSIINKVITDCECTFLISSTGIPVFSPEDIPYKPTIEGKSTAYGLQKFNKTVEFFFIENTVLTQTQVYQIQNDYWVHLIKDFEGNYLVFGLENGLKFKSSSQDFNSVETHGGISLVMSEDNVNTPMMFTDKNTYDWINYDVISGIKIDDTGIENIVVSNEYTAYLVQPDGSIVASEDGVIDTTWSGVIGDAIILIPKNSIVKDFFNSDFITRLSGKNINFLGDSITKGLTYVNPTYEEVDHPYPETTSNKFGANNNNYGISGTHISGAYTGDGIESAQELNFVSRYNLMSNNSEYVVVLGGVNDFLHTLTAPFGKVTDMSDISFCGALNVLCSGLKNKYYGKKVIFCTPLKTSNCNTPNTTTGKKLVDYANAIKTICLQYEIPVYDSFNLSYLDGTITSIVDDYMPDGIHLNQGGYNILAKEVYNFIFQNL